MLCCLAAASASFAKLPMNFLLSFLALFLSSLFASVYSAWAFSFCSLVRALLRFSFFDLFKMTYPSFAMLFLPLKYFLSSFCAYLFRLPQLVSNGSPGVLHILEGLVLIPGRNRKLLGNKEIFQ